MSDKILIIHSGGIGDLLLALPAMRIFRQAFPQSILELLGRPERLDLLAHDLRASLIHSIDQGEMAYFYAEEISLPAGMSAFFSSFRAVLVFGKASGDILVKNLKRIGVKRVLSVPSFPPEDLKVQVSDFLVDSLMKEGIVGKNEFIPLHLPEESIPMSRDFWARLKVKEGEPMVAIHPGSGSPAKNWEPKNFAEVGDWASDRSRVLLVVGPADGVFKEVKREMKKAKPVIADHLPLIQLAGVLQSCTAYVGNDSGITHLAATLGIPTVAIFGLTDPAVWGPKGPQVKIIDQRDLCSPWAPEVKSEWGRWTLAGVNSARVIKMLASFLR